MEGQIAPEGDVGERVSLRVKRAEVVIAAVIASGAPLEAQTIARERFELFNECQPVNLIVVLGDGVDDLPEPLTKLTKERVRTLAESRLRAARLFSSAPLFPLLSISVEVLGQTSVRTMDFSKMLHDPISGETHVATTWKETFLNRHRSGSDGAATIMQGLSESVDTFILEYLRVNGESCNNGGGAHALIGMST